MTLFVRKTVVRQVTSCPRLGDPLAALLLRAPGAPRSRRWITAAPVKVNRALPTLPPAALGTWGFIGSALPSGTPDILQERGWKAAGAT